MYTNSMVFFLSAVVFFSFSFYLNSGKKNIVGFKIRSFFFFFPKLIKDLEYNSTLKQTI